MIIKVFTLNCESEDLINQNPLDPKQIVSFEELLLPQVIEQEALTRLLLEKGIFTKEEFLGMVKVVNREMKRKKKGEM